MRPIIKIASLNFFAGLIFLFDRTLKYAFSAPGGEYFIFGDFLKLKLALNPGIAFGLPINFALVIALYLIILLILFWLLAGFYRQKKYWLAFALTLIIFGAFSNLLDRFYLGRVVDYIDVKYWSVFNLADAMIICGIGMFLVANKRIGK